ncbi:acyl-CoA/acyl-ACP dehydrogenase [Streptosporangium sp. NBC_01639]|uniref:acyl-CoA dehydrogenase family protein n=1 Tax=Streptosporangium sp. NBC_01639 TaxID=2975948 RepID=UPI00386FF571|nr:acyl-CoA/acyl-ACP dehydrogenase [Streptosporangium sp. NBC_01639]
MDFNLDETQSDLRKLAVELLGREVTGSRLEAHEKSGAPYDAELWGALAQAGLLGVCLPEEAGGAGFGPVELAVVLREIGAHVAPVPVQQSLVAALAVARYGSREQREALAPLAEGETVLTSALREPGRALGATPAVTARRDGGGWVLDGRTGAVPYAAEASKVLVPAATEDGVGVFLVAPETAGLRPLRVSTGEPAATLTLDGSPGEPLGSQDGEAFGGLRRLALAGTVAVASGVLAGALALTTEYIRTRRQFDRALAEFQAVTVQIADVYIAGRTLDVAMWAGVWRLAEGPAEEAEADLAVGALTVTDSALAALYTCQHLHGGVGLDVTYPLHRYFAWGKHHAHLLGGVEARLDTIGALV